MDSQIRKAIQTNVIANRDPNSNLAKKRSQTGAGFSMGQVSIQYSPISAAFEFNDIRPVR